MTVALFRITSLNCFKGVHQIVTKHYLLYKHSHLGVRAAIKINAELFCWFDMNEDMGARFYVGSQKP